MSPEPEPKPQERYPYIAYIGGVGVGKTNFAALCKDTFGLPLFEEEYADNPYLPKFYTVDPKKYAFDTQFFFLAQEGKQMPKLPEKLTLGPIGHDQPLEGDAFFESVLAGDLEYINDSEHRIYRRSYVELTPRNLVPRPDVYIGLTSSPETAVRRIIERGREMEVVMNECHPEYFPTIVRAFNSWITWLSRHRPVVIIDTERWDFIQSEQARNFVLAEFRDCTSDYLTSPDQMNSMGIDGVNLIIPEFLKPIRKYYNITQGPST